MCRKDWLPRLRFTRPNTFYVANNTTPRLCPYLAPPLASPPLPLESNRISFRSTFFFLFHTCNEEVKRNDETSSVVRLQGFPPTGFTHLGRNFQDGLVLVVCNKLAIFAEAW